MSDKTYLNSNPFQVDMYVEKSYVDEGTNRRKIRGVASGPKKDRQGHMFSQEGILSIQKAIEEGHIDPEGDWSEIPLVYEHETKWDSEIGWVTKAEIDDEGQLWIEAELDETSNKANELYKRLTTPKRNGKMRQFGLSVKGKVTHYHKVWDEVQKSFAPVFNKMQLDEITVTSQPCYPADAYLAIAKSLNSHSENDHQEEINMSEVQKTEETQDVEKSIFNRQPDAGKADGPMGQHQSAEEIQENKVATTEVEAEDLENVEDLPNEEVAHLPDQDKAPEDADEVESTVVDNDDNTEAEDTGDSEVSEESGDEAADQKPEGTPGYATHVVNVEKSLGDLDSRMSKLEEAIDTLITSKENSAPASTEGDTELDVQKSDAGEPKNSELERIESIVADAITKIAGELEIVKSLVNEVAGDPADKSINIVKSKSDEDPQTPDALRRKYVEEGVDPIRAAFKATEEFARLQESR